MNTDVSFQKLSCLIKLCSQYTPGHMLSYIIPDEPPKVYLFCGDTTPCSTSASQGTTSNTSSDFTKISNLTMHASMC